MTANKISGARVIEPNIVRTADGVNLFYRDWGDGEPVLFVAGWSMGADSWCYQMLALAQRRGKLLLLSVLLERVFTE